MSSPVTVRAPAKINLHLGVGAPHQDGFHPLDTVYQAIGIYDDLAACDAETWVLTVATGDHLAAEAVPPDQRNIVHRAARLLSEFHGVPLVGEVRLTKDIPIAGGMAGGSADAAAALVALDRLWGVDTPDDDLLRIAAELGCDVPFALIGGSARGTGRGEVVRRVPDAGVWWWAVVPSRAGLSTPTVYHHFDTLVPDAPAVPPPGDAVLAALSTGVPALLAAALHNDLQAPAIDLRPELGGLISRGVSEGALRGMVSGSGPTVVFLCDSAAGARAVASGLGAPDQVVLVATGAVAGAHILRQR